MSFPDTVEIESDDFSLTISEGDDWSVEVMEPDGSITVAEADNTPLDLDITEPVVTLEQIEDVTIFEIPGLPGDSRGLLDIEEVVTTELIPDLSFITASGKRADSNNIAHFNRVIGFVLNQTLNAHVAQAIVEGDVEYEGWNWSVGQELFLNGTALSSVSPTSGFSQLCAVAKTPTVVFVRLQIPIML